MDIPQLLMSGETQMFVVGAIILLHGVFGATYVFQPKIGSFIDLRRDLSHTTQCRILLVLGASAMLGGVGGWIGLYDLPDIGDFTDVEAVREDVADSTARFTDEPDSPMSPTSSGSMSNSVDDRQVGLH